MVASALTLALAAAVLHAVWNLLLARARDVEARLRAHLGDLARAFEDRDFLHSELGREVLHLPGDEHPPAGIRGRDDEPPERLPPGDFVTFLP